MYECMDCGAEFETPMKAIDPNGCPDEPEIETCPACGSDDIVEVDDYYEADTVDELFDELNSDDEEETL